MIAKRILSKKKAIMQYGQREKITGTICNIPVDNIDVIHLLPRTADSNGLVIVELKHKLEYCGNVLFEAVRSDFLRSVLS